MSSVIYYEDIEKEVVGYFSEKFSSDYLHIATKTPTPDETDIAENWLVVTVVPGRSKTPVTRFYGLTLDIYASDYATASSLGIQIDFWLRNLTETRSIKAVEVIAGPVRLGDESTKEKRSISAELVVKAWTD